ncbi:MAG: DUF87 domain-containing protein [Clostridia bacterium]|nr:DUF87 domain-containing protein [Clostridia bacterium]
MFGKIIYISDTSARVELKAEVALATNLMNVHVVFEDQGNKILGEIYEITSNYVTVTFLGQFLGNKFFGGIIRKPTLSSQLRIITSQELAVIVGNKENENFLIGGSVLYNNYPIMVNINDFFSNHFAIFGNSGSGKSCGVARIIQNLFSNPSFLPYNANFMFFDSYGEYHNAFKDLGKDNPNYNFKYYSTNEANDPEHILRVPLWVLGIDDFALLLQVDSHSQMQILERMLKMVSIFSANEEQAVNYKNHLIAKGIMNILYTNQTSSSKRNDIFSIINGCETEQFNLNAPVQGLGYTRTLRECFNIDTKGNFPEMNLVIDYVSSFIDDELDKLEVNESNFYTLEDLEKALSFTLISEGLLKNEQLYDESITLKVRLHSLVISEHAKFFRYPEYVTVENYIASLVSENGKKAQIINFNLDDVDDSFAKTITKIFARLLFTFTKNLGTRASVPFHLVLEEAHRYVQSDNDRFLLGYNIFERIAKEGRKYGIVLNLISQRPVELSDTVISQCSNFIIFKMTHPMDIEYIKKMLPNISADIIEKQKSLQPGMCVAFGKSFKVPMIVKMEMPNPEPHSSNCDVVSRWQRGNQI